MVNTKYLYLSYLKGARNISIFLFIYIISILVPRYELQNTLIEQFMRIYGYIFLALFLVGSYASQKIKESKGDFEHFKYFNIEVTITLVLIVLLEFLIF